MTNETTISKPLIEGENHFDVAIIGGGLAGLVKADLLSDSTNQKLRVVIIDPDPQSLKKKTFSSWRKFSEAPHRYSKLVENRWSKFRITDPSGTVIENDFGEYRYERISGEQLFHLLDSKLKKDPRFVRIQTHVVYLPEEHAQPDRPNMALIQLANGESITAETVFSSPVKSSTSVIQYFFGFEIETNSDQFDAEVVDLMDFSVAQEGDVRFVYILPFSKRRALVEFTVFSERKLPDQVCESILRNYISEKLKISDFSIFKTESGVIPMTENSEAQFPPFFRDLRIEVIGSAAGMIKPSTGYSFLRNIEALSDRPERDFKKFRFRVYDALLLDLIRKKGGHVARILAVLFRNNPSSRVFSFLDEQSNLRDELRIFYSLPWLPFLGRLLALYPFFFAVLATLLLHFTMGGIFSWVIPILGLLSAGIGHGSLDHLIDSSAQNRIAFYTRYLGSIALFLGTWYLFPAGALAFFIFQSADHFGEAYWIRSIRNSRNDIQVRSLAWIWGLFAALFGVLFHWVDSLPLIGLITGNENYLASFAPTVVRLASILLFGAAVTAAFYLDRYNRRATGQPSVGVAATFLLGISVMVLPLLPGFFCFFAFWHGWDSMKIQRQLKGWSSTDYFWKAFPFTVISLIGILALIYVSSNAIDSQQVWKILFITIGALTAAHAPIMKKFLLSAEKKEV